MIKRLLFILVLSFCTTALIAQNYNMGNSNVTACNGTFYDSGGNNQNYDPNETYVMTFCASTSGSCIRLTFSAFNTEAGFDFVRIYNGPDTLSPVMGTYSGTTNPGTLTANSGCITIRFTSDGTIQSSGWAAAISCVTCATGNCNVTCNGGAPPANDNCTAALSLGTLPLPPNCPDSSGTPVTIQTTNLCATPTPNFNPLTGCRSSTANNTISSPAADVWYRFTITGPLLDVLISGGLQEPQISLYSGTTCTNLIARGCAIGNAGALNTTFGSLAPGTYYLQVNGGTLNDQCNFSLTLRNRNDCAGCVIASSFTVNPPPVNGTYQAGQTVNFCYTISNYNQTSSNWLHAVIPTFGAGWNMSTLVTTPATNCSAGEGGPFGQAPGTWSWYNGSYTSSANPAVTIGPGFFFETRAGSPNNTTDNNPANNYGDYNPNNTCTWTFCWSITTLPPNQCVQGASLNVTVDSYGDGESGSWTSIACTTDPITEFFAQLICCEQPVINQTSPPCVNGTASATATGQGTSPWSYVWRNNSGTILQTANNVNGSNTISNLPAGTYTVTVTDFGGCTSTQTIVIPPAAPVTSTANVTNATCNGSSNGSIAVTPSGGTSPYTYSWSNSATSGTVSNLAAGSYTVTITDAAGCTATQSYTITQPTPVTANITPVATSCGLNNGSATVAAGGGTGPYTYNWSPSGGSGTTASNLAAGNYTATVTDSRGCSTTSTTTIPAGPLLSATISSTVNSTCNRANGSATASPSGGTAPFTYLWSPSGGSGATANNLSAGTYTVRITDASGCTATTTVNISTTPVVTATVSSVTNINCNGSANGSVAVNASGGTPNFTYSWSPSGGNGSTASNLAAGNYTVTVTDAIGCTATATASITQPPLVTAALNPTPVNCNGASNGSIAALAAGGTGSYTYSWSPSGGTGSTATGLAAGNYSVTVTDANGCTATANTTVTQPSPLSYTSSTTPSLCGSNTGSASIAVSGGVPNYTYAWSPIGGTGSTANNLSGGAYTVTVTDGNGCTLAASIAVSNTSGPTVTINNNSNILCNGQATGSATLSVNGGTAPYTFNWSPVGGANASASNLPAGTYIATVTDGNNCVSTASVTITEPPLLTASVSSTNHISCANLSNGSASISASGGNPAYTYSWSAGGSTSTSASNLAAGNYTVTVTDQSGCTATTSITLTQPPALTVTTTPVNVSCAGLSNGSVSASSTGGTGNLTYNWSPAGGSNATATSLPAGTYSVTVTDANGCTTTSTATVTQPGLLTANIVSSSNVSCNGADNGSASIQANGGISAYSYTWTPSGGNNATANNLSPGTYTALVTDANGCSATASVSITEPPLLTTSISGVTSVSCNGLANGSAVVAANGGTPAYNYTWSPGNTSGTTLSNAVAGTYTVTVSDASGCTATSTVTITQPTILSVNTVPSNVLCNGSNSGSIVATATGGTPVYSYSWTPAGGNAPNATGLLAGNYTVTITDANGCTTATSQTITEPLPLNVNPSVLPSTCGNANGSVSLSVSGGNGAYTYNWTPSVSSGSTATGLAASSYQVIITDANNCTSSTTLTVADQPGPIVNANVSSNVSCNGGANGSATAGVNLGTAPLTYTWTPSGGNTLSAANLSAGSYTITVTDANGCLSSASVTITEPLILTAQTSAIPALCFGSSTGSASVIANGGAGNYTYAWSPVGGINATATGIPAGNYSVTVTDNNGCTTTASATVNEPTAVSVSMSSTGALCNGSATGSTGVATTGGTPGYTYQWSPSGGTNSTANSLAAGTYTVTVTDANNCTATGSVTVTEPTAMTATVSNTSTTCGNNNGTAQVSASGGTGNYSYTWSSSANTSLISNLAAGNYTVTVTDANGCSTTASTQIINIPGPTITATANTHVACNGGSNGNASSSVNSGTAPFTYSWTPAGGSAATAANLSAGTYSVTVTDANGCIASTSVTITEPVLLSATAASNPVSCNGGNTGSASVIANGGTGAYNYSWSPSGGIASTANSIPSGTYTVTVTDANGCSTTASTVVTEPTALIVNTTSADVSCNGGNNGNATANVSGGTFGYSYQWSPSGGATAAANNLSAGTYTITVTDANGCTATSIANVNEPSALTAAATNTSSTCGNSNGTATVTASGGTANYSYVWSNGNTGSNLTGISAGSYNVTITDANGCTTFTSTTVLNIAGPTANTSITSNVSCNGGSNGSAAATTVGGTAPLAFSWTPSGGSNANATNLSAGNYSVTVTDANGCTAISALTITQPPLLSGTASSTAVLCNGGSSGSATVTATGGTGNYSYVWSPSGGTGATANGIATGNYTVTITDANGCTATASATVTQPTALNLSLNSIGVNCNGNATGSAMVTATGGTGSYSYNWSSGSSTAGANNLPAGNYSVIVTDANGCTANGSVTITEPSALSSTTSSTPATCGTSNGSGTVAATGGVSPYTFAWSPTGGTASTATGLAAGNYNVIITDARGCTANAAVAVSNIGGPTLSAAVTNNVSCNGGSNGSASVQIVTGNGPYTYVWSPSGGNSSSASNLPAGNYSVSVTDVNGCISGAAVSITEPSALFAQASSTAALCNGTATGSVASTANGGSGNYSYRWTPGNANTANVSGLTAGTYTVTITDGNGCTSTASTLITQPAAMTLSMNSTPASCNGATNGSASVTVNGGTAGYTYNWSPIGGTGSSANGLSAGTYGVIVTDANGCTSGNTVSVNQATAINILTSTVSATCGASNGSASVSATGGTLPYAYLWSPAGGNLSVASGLAAGNYTVTITDANGCSNTSSVIVSNIGGPSLGITSTNNVSCFGGSNGSATISTSGGTGPFTYLWTPTGGAASGATNLSAGNYTVLVTDASNCASSIQVTITQPGAITLQTTSTPAGCNQASGSATVLATGGAGNFSYAWTPSGSTNSTASNLLSGNYQVTVTDANSCSQTTNVTVGTTGGPSLLIQNITDADCNGNASGSATLTASGGAGPYTYAWSPSGGNGSSANGLQAGNYVVTVTDGNNCTSTASIIISEPDAIMIQTSSTPAACNGGADGSVSAIATGGSGPYSYLWSPGGSTNATMSGLTIGNYTVLVTDVNGCVEAATATVNSATAINIIPSSTNILCNGQSTGQAGVQASGGTPPYNYQWTPSGGSAAMATNLTAGNYSVVVTDANGCASITNFSITEPTVLNATLSGITTICQGQSATLEIDATGGTSPYTYQWSNNFTGASQSVSPAVTTTYSALVTDANGCTAAIPSAQLIVRPPLDINANGPSLICSGQTVNLTSVATGGDGNYTFNWTAGNSNGSSTSFTPSGDTTVTVTVSDGCGSSPVSATVTINVEATPTVNFIPNNVSGCVPVTVDFNNLSDYVGGSTFNWDFGDQESSSDPMPTHTYTEAGTFDVSLQIVTPAGCVASLAINDLINVYPYPSALFSSSTDTTTQLQPVIQFENLSTGASLFQWDFGDGSDPVFESDPSHQYEDTGNFVVTLIVQNSNGCSDTIRGMIRVEDGFSIYIPNAFTPNGDGVNETFMPLGMGWKSFEMFILDRWGLNIFHSTAETNPWDGSVRNGNERCQNDVYVYKIFVRDNKDKMHTYIGHVTLVR